MSETLFYSKYSPNSKSFLELLEKNNVNIEKVCVDNRDVRERIRESGKVSQVPFILCDSLSQIELYEGLDVFKWLRKKIPPVEKIGKTQIMEKDSEIVEEKDNVEVGDNSLTDHIRDRYTIPKGKKTQIPDSDIADKKQPTRIVKENTKTKPADIKNIVAKMEQERKEMEEIEIAQKK